MMAHSRAESLFADLRKSQMIRVCSLCHPDFKSPAGKTATHGYCEKHLAQEMKKAGMK